MNYISTIESLPDELLLEICKYLLCVDVLISFENLNKRMTRMISDYYRHVSLHKASYKQSREICLKILPEIGTHVRTLTIDNCYSALQGIAFPKYFHDSMSVCFPELQKVILVSFRPDPLLIFLKSLRNLEKLHTIDIRSLFRVPTVQQTKVLLALLQANNHRITTVHIDDQSSNLSPIKKFLPDQIVCSNIIDLKIELSTILDLSVLFGILPNVNNLSVSIHKKDSSDSICRISNSPKLDTLYRLQLKSIERSWCFNELAILLEQFSSVKYLSLNLRTSDSSLINGEILKTCLPSTLQEFYYAVHYLPEQTIDYDEIVNSWKHICSITCLFNPAQNDYMYLHTVPHSSLDYLEISSSVAGSIFKNRNSYENIQRIHVDCDVALAEAFPIIGYCRRAKHVMIWLHETDTKSSAQQRQPQMYDNPILPKLPHLRRLSFLGNSPNDLYHISTILHAAVNVFRLDLNYATLISLLDNSDNHLLLRQRITALTINNMSSCSITAQKHVSVIASVFTRLRHLYIDMRSLSTVIDPMVVCYFDEFSKFNAPLISLCADGKPSNEMEVDAEQWLVNHRNHLQQGEFAAFFNKKAGRLLIWM